MFGCPSLKFKTSATCCDGASELPSTFGWACYLGKESPAAVCGLDEARDEVPQWMVLQTLHVHGTALQSGSHSVAEAVRGNNWP
jgi:hypothetical protein